MKEPLTVEQYTELIFSALRTKKKFNPNRSKRFKGPLPGCRIEAPHAASDCAYCRNI